MGANGISSAQIWLDGLAGDFKRPVASYLRLQTYSQEGRAECQHQYPETVDEANEIYSTIAGGLRHLQWTGWSALATWQMAEIQATVNALSEVDENILFDF